MHLHTPFLRVACRNALDVLRAKSDEARVQLGIADAADDQIPRMKGEMGMRVARNWESDSSLSDVGAGRMLARHGRAHAGKFGDEMILTNTEDGTVQDAEVAFCWRKAT